LYNYLWLQKELRFDMNNNKIVNINRSADSLYMENYIEHICNTDKNIENIFNKAKESIEKVEADSNFLDKKNVSRLNYNSEINGIWSVARVALYILFAGMPLVYFYFHNKSENTSSDKEKLKLSTDKNPAISALNELEKDSTFKKDFVGRDVKYYKIIASDKSGKDLEERRREIAKESYGLEDRRGNINYKIENLKNTIEENAARVHEVSQDLKKLEDQLTLKNKTLHEDLRTYLYKKFQNQGCSELQAKYKTLQFLYLASQAITPELIEVIEKKTGLLSFKDEGKSKSIVMDLDRLRISYTAHFQLYGSTSEKDTASGTITIDFNSSVAFLDLKTETSAPTRAIQSKEWTHATFLQRIFFKLGFF